MAGAPDLMKFQQAGVPTGQLVIAIISYISEYPLKYEGKPLFPPRVCPSPAGLSTDNGQYWFFHHTEGDTMDVLDSRELDLAAALWTAVAYVAADLTYKLPQGSSMDTAEAD